MANMVSSVIDTAKRDGRVLEDVHRLAGERRDDDAKGHRQDHVAVGLRVVKPMAMPA
jgi:hypothetical protein